MKINKFYVQTTVITFERTHTLAHTYLHKYYQYNKIKPTKKKHKNY